MPTIDQAEAFMKRLVGLLTVDASGKSRLEVSALRALVREDPELTVVTARMYLSLGPSKPGNYQLAFSLASAYDLEFGDDSLVLVVKRAMQEAGGQSTLPIAITESEASPTEASADTPGLYDIAVDDDSLRTGDPYTIVRLFAIGRADAKSRTVLASLRGRCLLTFPVSAADPRAVWEVPEARRFVASLYEAMPYFPYYLFPASEAGMMLVFFGSMADPEAFQGSANIDLMHPSVLDRLIPSLAAVARVGDQLGDDPLEVCRYMLSGCPPGFADWLLSDAISQA